MRITVLIVLAGLLLALAGCGAPTIETPLAATNIPIPIATPSRQGELLVRVGKGKIHDVLYTPDGEFILAAFDTGLGTFDATTLNEVAFWDLPEKSMRLTLLAEKEVAVFTTKGNILFVSFDPASGAFSASKRAELTTEVMICSVDEYPNPILLASSPDGKFLAVSFTFMESVQAWNLETGRPILSDIPQFRSAYKYQLSFSNDSQYLLLSGGGQRLDDNFLVKLADGNVTWSQKGNALLQGGNKLMYWNRPEEYSLAPVADPMSGQFIKFIVTDGQKMIFSPDGSLGAIILWSAGLNGLWLFQTETGQIINHYEGMNPYLDYTDAPVYLSNTGMLVTYYSKNSQEAATSGQDNKSTKLLYTPFVLDLEHARPVQEITPPFEIPYPLPLVYFAPDGGSFLYADRSSLVCVEPSTQKITSFVDQLTSGVTALAFAPDGKTLAAGQQNSAVAFFDTAKGLKQTRSELLHTAASDYPGDINGLAFFSNGKQLAADNNNGSLYVLTVDGSRPPTEISLNPGLGKGGVVEMLGLAISPDGRTLATGGYENAVRLWTNFPPGWGFHNQKDSGGVTTISYFLGAVTYSLLEDSSVVTSIAYSSDGKLIAAGTEKGHIRLWRADGTLERTLSGNTSRVTGLVFAGETLVSVAEDGSARFWQISDGTQTRLLNLGESVTSLALDSPDEILALGTESGKTYLWEMVDNRWLGVIPIVGAVRALAFHPNATQLAIGSESGQIQLWQVRLANGQVAQLPAGEPQDFALACKMVGQVEGFSEGTFVAGGPAHLEWRENYSGDCSKVDKKSLREVENTPALAAEYSLTREVNYSADTHLLHIFADVTVPATPGTYKYTWELVTPTDELIPFSAMMTVIAPPAGLNLPAPLYFISESGVLTRLEIDGRTLIPIIAGPVTCMDISPASGEIAYLSNDALMMADLNGVNQRALLPIGGCPSWSPDGTQIGFTLNGVKVLNVSNGEVRTLATDLHAFGIQSRHYIRVLDWSPFSNKLIASVGGWESIGLRVFDVPSGAEFGLQGFSNPAWSRDGETVYTGEYSSNVYGWSPFIIRTNIASRGIRNING